MTDLSSRSDPLKPGYPFNAHLVAGITPIIKDGELDFWIDRPNGLKGYIINITVSGAGLVFPNTKHARTVTKGDMMILPTSAIHDYGRHPEFHNWYHRWIYFRPRATWHEWLDWTEKCNNVGFLSLRKQNSEAVIERIDELFQMIDETSQHDSMLAEELSLNLLEQVLIRCREFDHSKPLSPIDPRIQRACQFINDNISRELSIEELAQVACMSQSRFSHLFKKQKDVSVRQWIEDQRISLARQLLITTDLAINQVAQYLGYQDALYFSRVFKKNLGESPREFRQSQR